MGVDQCLDPGGPVGREQGPRIGEPGQRFDGLGDLGAGVRDRHAGPLVGDGGGAAPRGERPAQDAAVAGSGGEGGAVGGEGDGVERAGVGLEDGQGGGHGGVAEVDQVHPALPGGREDRAVRREVGGVQLVPRTGTQREGGVGGRVSRAEEPQHAVGADGGDARTVGQGHDSPGAGGGLEP